MSSGGPVGVSPEQRAEWKRLADEASPGPWFAWRSVERGMTVQRPAGWVFVESERGTQADAEFAAAAREAVPALLSALESVEARLAEVERERDALQFVVQYNAQISLSEPTCPPHEFPQAGDGHLCVKCGHHVY